MKLIIALALYWAFSIGWSFALCAVAGRPQPKPTGKGGTQELRKVRSVSPVPEFLLQSPCGGRLLTLNPNLIHA